MREVVLICSSIMMCALCFFVSQDRVNPSNLLINPVNSIRQMQLEVMARRAAATGHRASQGYLPTAQYQSGIPVARVYQNDQVYRPQLTGSGPARTVQLQSPQQYFPSRTSSVGKELSYEAKSAHADLSGALSAFHGAALPQASDYVLNTNNANSQQTAQLSSFHEKLFKIFTAPESDNHPSITHVQSMSSTKTGQNSAAVQKNEIRAFHDQMFKIFTSPTSSNKAQEPPVLSQQTVDNVISVDPPHVAAAKGRLAAFHDHLFQLFTTSSDGSSSAALKGVDQLQTDSALLSRDAQRLKEVHAAARQRRARESAASMADKGFFSLWKGGSAAAPSLAKPAQVDEGASRFPLRH